MPKQRRLIGKQKYQQVSAHLKEVKAMIDKEWRKHGAASDNQHPVRRTNTGFVIDEEQRDPKTNTAGKSHLETLPNIHQSHHKMMIRNTVFCRMCGCSTSRKTQRLVCNLKPKHSHAKHKLKRMLEGKRPYVKFSSGPMA